MSPALGWTIARAPIECSRDPHALGRRCTGIDISSSLEWRDEEGAVAQGSNGSLMHYWYVGMDAYMLIVSCFVEATMQDDPQTAHVLSSVEPAIRSFRRYRDV